MAVEPKPVAAGRRLLRDELPPQQVERHPSDVLRVAIGVGVLVIAIVVAKAAPDSRIHQNFFRLINEAPNSLTGVARVVSAARWRSPPCSPSGS